MPTVCTTSFMLVPMRIKSVRCPSLFLSGIRERNRGNPSFSTELPLRAGMPPTWCPAMMHIVTTTTREVLCVWTEPITAVPAVRNVISRSRYVAVSSMATAACRAVLSTIRVSVRYSVRRYRPMRRLLPLPRTREGSMPVRVVRSMLMGPSIRSTRSMPITKQPARAVRFSTRAIPVSGW